MTEREYLQRERGLCSNRDCDSPIVGWCATCDAMGPFKAPELCMRHLRAHMVANRAGSMHYPHLLYEPAQGGGR